jgi:hypothetical protein
MIVKSLLVLGVSLALSAIGVYLAIDAIKVIIITLSLML